MAPESWLTGSGSLVRTLSEFPGGSQLRLGGAGYTEVRGQLRLRPGGMR